MHLSAAFLAAIGIQAAARSTAEPCALVSKALGSNGSGGKVNADLAYQCLQSVPLDVKGAGMQLHGIKAFTQVQSTLAYLKNPPEGFLYPAVDILEALDLITFKLMEDGYAGEYDFQLDVRDVIDSAYDGHFSYAADITAIFRFRRELPLHSISTDGLALPEIYLGADTTLLQTGNHSSVSPVASINGREVQAWLNDYAALHGSGDPDANYNEIFPTFATNHKGSFRVASSYQGNHTDITFRNGTTLQIEHWAYTSDDFTGVVDGQTFYQRFCTGDGKGAAVEAKPAVSSTTDIPATQVPFKALPTQTAVFPDPVISSSDGIISGFFPTHNNDLAVLQITSFDPMREDATEFSNVIRVFLATAQASGKTKLMLDLTGNPGGRVPLAYDLFAQLFPNIYPYGTTNFRTFPLINDLGEIISGFYSNITNTTASPDDCYTLFDIAPFNYHEMYDKNEQAFPSWKAFNGPHEHNNDNFTSLSRTNLADKYSTSCYNVSNYGALLNITPQVFRPEDVVLVQDGGCASTCAVFTEFMKTQANITQIVFGGRAQLGPMQGVGGVKGTLLYGYGLLLKILDEAYHQDATPAQLKKFDKAYDFDTLLNSTFYAFSRAAGTGSEKLSAVNMRNNIRLDDETVTPLQFVYEAADCRLFYTADMVANVSFVWEAAYDVHWGKGKCVKGSTGHPSSRQGNRRPNTPPVDARQNVTVFPSGLLEYKSERKVGRGEWH